MYFINFAKCSMCKQVKSVATKRNFYRKVCSDCNPEAYLEAAEAQKQQWIMNNNTKGTKEL